MNCELSIEAVWEFLSAGCNAREIAAYAGVSESVGIAMAHRAIRCYARAA